MLLRTVLAKNTTLNAGRWKTYPGEVVEQEDGFDHHKSNSCKRVIPLRVPFLENLFPLVKRDVREFEKKGPTLLVETDKPAKQQRPQFEWSRILMLIHSSRALCYLKKLDGFIFKILDIEIVKKKGNLIRLNMGPRRRLEER
ncbi:unnamed protein product [Thlaspi arvense]|uniref:Uncharacterized protein n=1 Tax=Thlaspi arvense TaxID=13288 RepID=A0AAU9RFT8_THLAR|nr:unnamed protein product [Thlaspi arvense]